MTHEKFIDSLNLYLDGELPPPEAAALEREIAGSPERRRIYRQYCQMQNACAELAERFREEAAPAPHFRKGAVVELQPRASGDWFRSIALVASGAVAACVVFVAVRQVQPAGSPAAVAQQQPAARQIVPFTTTVAYGSNPAGFRNPWNSQNREIAVDFSRLAPGTLTLKPTPVDLTKPFGSGELKVDMKPYDAVPVVPVRIEEIDATAFQFQR